MEDQGRRIKVEVRGSRSGEGSRSGVKVGGGVKVWGVEVVVKVGVKIEGGVMVGGSRSGEGSRFGGQGCGQGRVSRSWGQGQGMIGGYKVGVSVVGQSRGSMSGGGVMVRGMRVKVGGVGVRWSVGFIVCGG